MLHRIVMRPPGLNDRPKSPPWRAAPVLVPRNGTRVLFRPAESQQPIGNTGR